MRAKDFKLNVSVYFSSIFINFYLKRISKLQKIRIFYEIMEFIKILSYKFLHLIKGNRNFNFLLIGRDNVNWAIDKMRQNAKYFLDLININTTKNIFKASHILCVWNDRLLKPEYFWIFYLKKLLKFKLISIVTNPFISRMEDYEEWTIERFNKTNIRYLKKIVDLWVVPSQKLYSYLEKRGFKTFLLPLYISNKVFYPINKTKKEICENLNLDFNKIQNRVVIGTFQRDSSYADFEKPRWGKNPDGLINILKNIPKDKFVLLISSPRRHYIINQCKKNNIPFIFYGDISFIINKDDDLISNNHTLHEINQLYNLSDLYLVVSLLEGGPLAILEASLTKTLIFSTDVGMAPDFLHRDLIFTEDNYKMVEEYILKFKENQEKSNFYLEYNYKRTVNVLNNNNYKKLYRQLVNHKY